MGNYHKKKGKDKLPLFLGNRERVNTIYASGCRPCLPVPCLPGMACTSSPRSCGSLSIVPPGKIAPSACQTPTEATPGLWMPPSHLRHRRIPPSPSAIGVTLLPVVGCCLGPGSSSPPSVPHLLRHRCYLPPPVPPPGIPSGKTPCPPPY